MADMHDTGFSWHDDHTMPPAPTRRRPSGLRLLGSVLVALVVISGLVGALLLATPAMETPDRTAPDAPEAAENR
ncbi:hypothetical protein FH609_025860 [Streptomyces sp. 3MP-14]|uniref:Uncharacterized protein n=1 Tax=Streptomyces mimosae TaxID=2586635 RepID=A0A5N6A1V1_9ACTN|nr:MULTISPECIES: hypothetical protein [Streptomyces]KAB8161650.1 hypothetical protein FH607_025090 [Streptomyces mimosae]KAB8173413.1 hypothetical protein FH609_025860 [Streptomyces sp. 3MP-14]